MTNAVLVSAVSLLAIVAPDLSGVWNLEMYWSGRDTPSTGVCTLKEQDGKLSGSCADSHSTITGEVHERRLTWRIDVVQDGQTPVTVNGSPSRIIVWPIAF
jgi:hypothetical protein